jgi:hypothetical protein
MREGKPVKNSVGNVRPKRALPVVGLVVAVGVIALLALGSFAVSVSLITPRPSRPGQPAKVKPVPDAEQVAAALDDLDAIRIASIKDYGRDWQDRLAAVDTYKGKICRLSGVVSRVDNGPSVTLRDVGIGFGTQVVCRFQKDESGRLDELQEGDEIDVFGMCHTQDEWRNCLLTRHLKIGR